MIADSASALCAPTEVPARCNWSRMRPAILRRCCSRSTKSMISSANRSERASKSRGGLSMSPGSQQTPRHRAPAPSRLLPSAFRLPSPYPFPLLPFPFSSPNLDAPSAVCPDNEHTPMRTRQSLSLVRRWWWVFGLFIATPAITLALLGLGVIRADEIQRRALLAEAAGAGGATGRCRAVDRAAARDRRRPATCPDTRRPDIRGPGHPLRVGHGRHGRFSSATRLRLERGPAGAGVGVFRAASDDWSCSSNARRRQRRRGARRWRERSTSSCGGRTGLASGPTCSWQCCQRRSKPTAPPYACQTRNWRTPMPGHRRASPWPSSPAATSRAPRRASVRCSCRCWSRRSTACVQVDGG